MSYPVITQRVGAVDRQISVVSEDDPYTPTVRTPGFGGNLSKACAQFLPEKGIALDLGANIGMTSFILSDRAAKVYAFEPNPRIFSILEQNIKDNGLSRRVRPFNVGISNEPGKMHIVGDSAYGHLTASGGQAVEVDTVDRIVGRLKLSRLDFIKIDVEGFEANVLEGAADTIAQFKPTIFMEFNAWCLMAFGRLNPFEFAESLFDAFGEISFANDSEAGSERVLRPDSLIHDNVVFHHGVDDLILRELRRTMKPPRRSVVTGLLARLRS